MIAKEITHCGVFLLLSSCCLFTSLKAEECGGSNGGVVLDCAGLHPTEGNAKVSFSEDGDDVVLAVSLGRRRLCCWIVVPLLYPVLVISAVEVHSHASKRVIYMGLLLCQHATVVFHFSESL